MNGYLRENKGRFHTLGLMIGAAILFVCSSADVYAEAKDCSEPGEFKIVVNREEQYSIAKCYEEDSHLWRSVDVQTKECGRRSCGTKQECLDTIEKLWPDLRPSWLKKALP